MCVCVCVYVYIIHGGGIVQLLHITNYFVSALLSTFRWTPVQKHALELSTQWNV